MEVNFIYSHIYDFHWKKHLTAQNALNNIFSDYPSKEIILDYIEYIDREWNLIREKLIAIFVNFFPQLVIKQHSIDAYVVGDCIPMSHPLTMRAYDKYAHQGIDILIHELLHILITDNWELCKKEIAYIKKLHPEEKKESFHVHVLLFYLQNKIYALLFNDKKRWENYSGYYKKIPRYTKSLEVSESILAKGRLAM